MMLRTLGGLELEGQAITRPKPLVLLAYLALEGPKPRSELAELFWLRRNALHNLAMTLTLLRQGAPGAVAADTQRVRTIVDVDVTRLSRSFEQREFEEVLALYRGPFLEGVRLRGWSAELEEWVYDTRERVARRVQEALLSLAENELRGGRREAAATRAEAAYRLPGAPALEPEELARLHDLLVAARSPVANEVRKEAAELNLSLPDAAGERAAPLRLPSSVPRAIPTNLGLQEAFFVGREAALRSLSQLLAASPSRLVTLTGPGGVGKTQLALRVARAHYERGDFEDGVYVVALGAVKDATLVVPSIAGTLGIPEGPATPLLESLERVLQDKSVLLVLDNFEQVMDASTLVGELLKTCPRLKMIVTSREALRLKAERQFPVPPLLLPNPAALPDAEVLLQVPAVALFVERARAVQPEFALTEANKGAVAELCVRLDGLPLAIELAASRINLFSPEAMLRQLGDRFALLKGGARDAPARHQTLLAAVAWSYDLLEDAERALFRRLSAFVGPVSLEAAAAVAEAWGMEEPSALDALAALTEKSLLSGRGDGRFVMLETLREFGLRVLAEEGELEEARRVQARYCLDLAERAAAELTGPEQQRWFERLEQGHANVRVALSRALETSDAEFGLRLGAALWRFWLARGHMREGRVHLTRLLALPQAEPLTQARAAALQGLGTVHYELGELAEARPVLEASLAAWRALGDDRGVAAVLSSLGWVACVTAEFAAARQRSQEALALSRAAGDRRGVAVALNNLGWAAMYQGELREAQTYFEKALAARRTFGEERGLAFALVNLAWAERGRGLYAEAAARLDEAVTVLEQLGDEQLLGWALAQQGQLAFDQGRFAAAAPKLEKSVALARQVGSDPGLIVGLIALAELLCAGGEPDRAALLVAEALPLCRRLQDRWAEAWARYVQGLIAAAHDKPGEAREHVEESFRIRRAIGDRSGVAECLEVLGGLALETGEAEQAARFLADAEMLRAEAGATPPPRSRPQHLAVRAELRARLGGGALAEARRAARRRIREHSAAGPSDASG